MLRSMKVLGRVFVLRRVATSHVAAGHTQAKMNPGVADLHAVFTEVLIRSSDFDLIQVLARHFFTFLRHHAALRPTSSASRSHFASVAPASYVLCRKSSSVPSVDLALRTSSYIRMNSLRF